MNRILRIEEVMKASGLSRSSLYRLEGLGQFPKRVRISPNSIGWFEHEVQFWMDERAKVRNPFLKSNQRNVVSL
ncbi:MAG: AlpA family phage regulatory protein [Bdellovibrionales bacterium]|nr:AlpA family phage regulatory protein [Bdellovibrionales bacterium]